MFLAGHTSCLSLWIWRYKYRCPVSLLRQVALLCDCKMIIAPHLPLPHHTSFPPHETSVAASSLFVNTTYEFHSLLFFFSSFLLIQCQSHNQHEQSFPPRHSFTLSFILSFIPYCATARSHSLNTLQPGCATAIVNFSTTLIYYMVQCPRSLLHTTRKLPVTNSCLLSFGSITTHFSIANTIY